MWVQLSLPTSFGEPWGIVSDQYRSKPTKLTWPLMVPLAGQCHRGHVGLIHPVYEYLWDLVILLKPWRPRGPVVSARPPPLGLSPYPNLLPSLQATLSANSSTDQSSYSPF